MNKHVHPLFQGILSAVTDTTPVEHCDGCGERSYPKGVTRIETNLEDPEVVWLCEDCRDQLANIAMQFIDSKDGMCPECGDAKECPKCYGLTNEHD